MKKIISIILIGILIGGVMMNKPKKIESTLTSTVNSATYYLDVRPNSSKSNNTLTLTQLLNFKNVVESQIQDKIEGLYDVDSSYLTQRIDSINVQLEGVNETTFNADFNYFYSLYESLFEIYSMTLESKNVEGRGIWHRPFESNLDEVRETLEALDAMGINMLYVETFWNGQLIYDSTLPDTFQHYFTASGYRDGEVDYGTNLLEAFIEEGKAYGIEVHAWVENFFVGYGYSYTDSVILRAHPEWASYCYDGTIPQKREINYLFMDPANPEVRDYLKGIYNEMASTMDIASIHLDYIRYPVAQNTTSAASSNLDTGYSLYAEREFKTLYGYEGDLRELVISNTQAALDWKEYKKNVISDFVAGVYYQVKTANSDVYLSTAIFGNLNSALNTKMQDWASWIEDGYVELILPMAYYNSSITVRSEVDNLTNIVNEHAFSYAGIAPSYMGYNDHLNTTQIEASIEGDAMGATFFASQHYLTKNVDGTNTFNIKVQNILKNGVFRNKAIKPHAETNLVIDNIFDSILDKAERIYITNNKMTELNKQDLEAVLTDIKLLPSETSNDLSILMTSLSGINPSLYATGAAAFRIQEDINYLIDILSIKQNRIDFDQSIDITVNPDPNTYFPDPIKLDPPSNIEISENILSWDEALNNSGYIVIVNGEEYQSSTTQFDITQAQLNSGDNLITVKTKGDDLDYITSDFNQIITLSTQKLDAPSNIKIQDNIIIFDPVEGASHYVLKVGLSKINIMSNSYDLSKLNLTDKTYTIEIKAIGNGYTTIDSNDSQNIRYTYGTNALENVFKDLFTTFAKNSTNEDQGEE